MVIIVIIVLIDIILFIGPIVINVLIALIEII